MNAAGRQCRCGDLRDAHTHFRPGLPRPWRRSLVASWCAFCDCQRFRWAWWRRLAAIGGRA